MMKFSGQWIWLDPANNADEYGEFYQEFDYNGGYATVKISASGDYALYLNGQFVECNQYGDYEYYKIYDELEISKYLKKGKNSIAVLAWHFGVLSSRYYPTTAGILFDIQENGKTVACSSENTLCRMSRAYINHVKRITSSQLGLSFQYDATKEDDWLTGRLDGFQNAVVQNKNCALFPRPIQKHVLLERVNGTVIKKEGNKILLDLGKEYVGLLSFSLQSKKEQQLIFSYGEHIEDGWVRDVIVTSYKLKNDFQIPYRAKAGENTYANYFYRLACRYIQIEFEDEIEIAYVGLIPQKYPIQPKDFPLKNPLDKQIYDTCVRTLELCMMEHYADGPWREQALYVLDSKNQMLAGYHAFENGIFEYARANLLLITKDCRSDGQISITCPTKKESVIPSFSLHYIPAILEYTEYSGDKTLAFESFGKCKDILTTFLNNRKDGLVCEFEHLWNFYEWSYLSSGGLFTYFGEKADQPDGYVNALTVIALDCFDKLCSLVALKNPFAGVAEEIKQLSYNAFFRKQQGMYSLAKQRDVFSVYGNALAVYSGIVTGAEAETLCEHIANNDGYECSLATRFFKYEALLKTNEEKYRNLVFEEIRKDYKTMLDKGATSFWEILAGADAFEKTGSLCHGWSAIPIYFYHKYFKA